MPVNFELWLTVLAGGTGVLCLLDRYLCAPRRDADTNALWADFAKASFPIFILVLCIRSFLVEPFRIPSASLEPSLLTGDFILVSKFSYGLRLPVLHERVVPLWQPERGDIAVFRWPPDPSVHYVKRVIGLPGDRIDYVDKTLVINDQVVAQHLLAKEVNADEQGNLRSVVRYEEDLPNKKHWIYRRPGAKGQTFHDIIVPEGYYLMLGDNRDDSSDSRVWGLVPQQNLVGKAFLIWFSWDHVHWGVRWKRLGLI